MYVDATEVAKQIRKELKATFTGVKFSVRTSKYSGGSSISVKWENYPTRERVEEITRKHAKIDYDEASGEILSGANRFVFAENKWTDEAYISEIERFIPEDVDKNHIDYHYWFSKMAGNLYQDKYKDEFEKPRDKVEAKESKRGRTVSNPDAPATKRQLFALHCITQRDTRSWEMTKGQASELIEMSKRGEDIMPIIEDIGL